MTARLAAAIVLMLGIETAAGDEFGRLFFAPVERATLDKLREQKIPDAADKAASPTLQYVSVNGVLRRSDDKNTVWLNHRAVSSRRTDGIGVATSKTDNHVMLTLLDTGRSFDLKVGQTVEIVSGGIEEGYARRAPPKPVAKAAPKDENIASDVTKVTPPAASQPLKSPAISKDPVRAVERDARKGLRPDSGPQPK